MSNVVKLFITDWERPFRTTFQYHLLRTNFFFLEKNFSDTPFRTTSHNHMIDTVTTYENLMETGKTWWHPMEPDRTFYDTFYNRTEPLENLKRTSGHFGELWRTCENHRDASRPSETLSVNSTPTAYTFLMHSYCTVILSLTSRTDLTHHAWLKNHGAHCQCLSPKRSHFFAQSRTSRITWWHRTRVLLLYMSCILLSASTPAEIYSHSRVAPWRSPDPLHFTSSGSVLKTRISSISPKTSRSLNTRISEQHRDTASGIGLRRWAISCSAGFTTVPTGARSKQVQNDRKFVTLNEKTWCPVHLKIR